MSKRTRIYNKSSFSSSNMVSQDDSMAEKCLVILLEELHQGRIRPGHRLGEVATANRLKMGRASVRAAFDRLAWAGILERIPRSGTFVKEVTLVDYCEIIDVRAGLESIAARLAATRLSESDFEELEGLAIRLDTIDTKAFEFIHSSSERKFKELNELDSAFHGKIAKASGNRRLYNLLSMQKLVECCMLISIAVPREGIRKRGGFANHQDVVKALRTRNPEKSSRTILEHLLGTKEGAIAHMSGVILDSD